MNTTIPNFNSKTDLFEFLKENKSLLITEKKSATKRCDAISFVSATFEKGEANKAIDNPSEFAGDTIKVESVINTTNIMDSHSDVHLNGIWSQTLKQKKTFLLLQEHKMTFENVISDNVKAKAEAKTWVELGFGFEGKTQALIFNSIVKADRNEYMFGQYLKGFVKNHSVGMQYVNIELAVNSEDKAYKEEKLVYDKYIDKIVNKDAVEAQGYFWAIKEAKIIEGSAVVMGSNQMTPTLNVSEKEAGDEATSIEPLKDTQKNIEQINKYNFNFNK